MVIRLNCRIPPRRAALPSVAARRQRGFTYLGALFAVVLIGILLARAGEVWHTTLTREREEELLFSGRQYANAIAAYYAATPGDTKQWPRTLEDLLEDRRGSQLKRHLRRLYRDPFTNRQTWGLIESGGFILGVYSLGEGRPFKQAGFAEAEAGFANAKSYRDWRFTASVSSNLPGAPAAAPPAAGENP